jgi:hypothetical protein
MALLDFHAALATDPRAGFLASFSSRTTRLPWLDAAAAYEDRYLLRIVRRWTGSTRRQSMRGAEALTTLPRPAL